MHVPQSCSPNDFPNILLLMEPYAETQKDIKKRDAESIFGHIIHACKS